MTSNFLSQLKKIVKKRKKRLGRGLGSGKGSKSSRGITRHQKAREDIPLAFEGGQGRIIKKFPLLRGKEKNKPVREKPTIVKLSSFNLFKNGEKVTPAKLLEKKIIKKITKGGIKILNSDQLKKKIIIKGMLVSQSAKNIIEKLGGKVNKKL
ncbi:MAG: 50S ribosomal protein L15 [Patescibacteria group bacterium]|nr:50S ribosomal protein L15 [Patescibacteria group bacterium]